MNIKIGTKVRAITDLPYGAGQPPLFKICKGELVTISRVEEGTLYFEEHSDQHGGWPASEFIPDGMFFCSSCENPVSKVLVARSVEMEWKGGTWIETEVFSQSIGCPICNEDIDASDLKIFGMKSP